MAGRPWSSTETQFLRRAVGKVPYLVIAKRIGRSVAACRQHALLLRLYVLHPNARYGPEFEAFLRRKNAEGWPADCTPLMCQILGVLEYRPRTRREICLALNRPYHTQHALRNGRGQTLTAVLMHKGYVIRYGRRPFAPGRGKTEYVYGLAPGFRRRKVSGVG